MKITCLLFISNLNKSKWTDFSNDYFQQLIYASLTKLGPTCKTVNDMKFWMKNIFLFDFLARVGMVQPLKKANIGYQDLLDKIFGWFLRFQFKRSQWKGNWLNSNMLLKLLLFSSWCVFAVLGKHWSCGWKLNVLLT